MYKLIAALFAVTLGCVQIAPAYAATRTFDVTMKFTKATVAGVNTVAVTNLPSDLVVNEGDDVDVTVKNNSPIPEGFSIDAFGVRDTFKPGQTGHVHLKNVKAGSYVMYCQLHPLSVHSIGHLLVVPKP